MRGENGVKNTQLEPELRAQHNVIARSQALASGMTDSMIRYRIRSGGPWQKLVPGVYVTVTGAVSAEHREMAALLHAGPRSVITGSAAARRHGVRAPGSATVDVIVPMEVRCQSTGFVRVRRTTRMPAEVCATGRIRFTGAARAAADAARAMTAFRDVRAVISETVQKRLCSIAMLKAELEQGPAKGSALLRAALAEVDDGIRSVTEGDLRVLLKRAQVPMPIFNARLYDGDRLIAIVDCWWPKSGVAGEVDSREYHYRADDWQRTIQRHDQLVARGVLLLHFTPQRIKTDPDGVIGEILSALDAGQRRPPLPIKALSASA